MYDQVEINKIEMSYNEYNQINQKLNSFDNITYINQR
jgi:hypothetical protein